MAVTSVTFNITAEKTDESTLQDDDKTEQILLRTT